MYVPAAFQNVKIQNRFHLILHFLFLLKKKIFLTDTVILLNVESESCIKFGFILYRNALQENDHGLMSMKAVFHSFISDQFKMNRYNKRCIIIKEREKCICMQHCALCWNTQYIRKKKTLHICLLLVMHCVCTVKYFCNTLIINVTNKCFLLKPVSPSLQKVTPYHLLHQEVLKRCVSVKVFYVEIPSLWYTFTPLLWFLVS